MWVFKAGSRSKFGRKGYLESQNETDEMVDNFTVCIADVSLSDGYTVTSSSSPPKICSTEKMRNEQASPGEPAPIKSRYSQQWAIRRGVCESLQVRNGILL